MRAPGQSKRRQELERSNEVRDELPRGTKTSCRLSARLSQRRPWMDALSPLVQPNPARACAAAG